MARMNHLLLAGWSQDLEAGTPPTFEDDLDMLVEVADTLDKHLWTVRRFHDRKASPLEAGPAPTGANGVALPPRAGA